MLFRLVTPLDFMLVDLDVRGSILEEYATSRYQLEINIDMVRCEEHLVSFSSDSSY